ncbi:hypothetical protein P7M70_25140, partial [Vibrio parahaemolyticus]|nr:hypothetical protein [Vibrio parahaemolyticus]
LLGFFTTLLGFFTAFTGVFFLAGLAATFLAATLAGLDLGLAVVAAALALGLATAFFLGVAALGLEAGLAAGLAAALVGFLGAAAALTGADLVGASLKEFLTLTSLPAATDFLR